MSSASDHSESFAALPLESSDTDNLSSGCTEDGSLPQESVQNKRKAIFSEQPVKKNPRLSQYNSNFHCLYNDIVNEIKCPVEADADLPWNPSRIGLSYWSPYEKEAFFIALDRKGPDDVKGISSFIDTKSEPEVRHFILALQDGLGELEQAARPLSELPAAFEVSQQCGVALEAASAELSRRQLEVEEAMEKRRYGEWWLLDYDTTVELEAFLSKDQLPASCEEIGVAARLFDVPRMTQLSALLFMNSKDPEWNWTTWLGDKSSPGLYGTSLIDFYNLVLGITKRVVSSSIFLAESRHQLQNEALGRTVKCVVKRRDIQAACKILGLKGNLREYWIGIARRCNLEVYKEPVFKRTKQQPLTYEEVEQCLVTDGRYVHIAARDHLRAVDDSNIVTIGDIAISHDGNYFAENIADDRAELLDNIASKEEEVRLWKMIGQDSPELAKVKSEDEMTLPRVKMDPDRVVKDWRKTISYKPPWQLKTGVPSERLFTERMSTQSRRRVSDTESSDNDRASRVFDGSGEGLSDIDDI